MREKAGINQIERNLSFKRIKSQKRYSLLILGITILTSVLLQMGFQMSAGIQNTFLENRKEIYGEWGRILTELDPRTETVIYENHFIEQKGKIEIYGVLGGDYIENKQSNIGTMDETAWELGRLKLTEGRLPRNENEIAMEYSMLLALGYEDSLGKEITLTILPSIDSEKEEEASEYVYTLCGIIKDYQVNWEISTRHRLPAGIVTSEGAKRIGTPLVTQMLIKAREGSESVYEDLERSGEISCGIAENFNQGKLVTENIPYKNFLDNIRLLIAGAAICILFVTIARSIDEREQSWKFLNALGMEKRQMYRMIVWEAVIYFAVSAVIGTIGGVMLYQLALPAFEIMTGKEIIRQISYKAVITCALSSALVIGISYFFSCMRFRKYLNGERKKQRKPKKKKARMLSGFTPLALVMHQWRYTVIRIITQILLLSSTFVMIGLGVFEVKIRTEELKLVEQTTGNGYYLDTFSILDSPGIRKEAAQSLSQIAGVESVETYFIEQFNSFTVNMSDYSDSVYLQKVVETEQMYVEDITIADIRLNILGMDQWKDMERFLNNLSEGAITREDFDSGDFCILVLPPLEKTEMGYLGNNAEESFQESFLMEDLIKVGDCLKITCHKSDGKTEEKPIRIDAILRTSKSADLCSPYPGGSGISIVTGAGFWNEFGNDTVNDYYQSIKILVSDDADALDTEKHIMRILKKIPSVNMSNYHELCREKKQELYSFIGMYSIFAVFYMILVFVVVYQMMEAESYERRKSVSVFKMLGMEDSFIKKMKREELLLKVLLSAVSGTVVLVCYYIIRIRN